MSDKSANKSTAPVEPEKSAEELAAEELELAAMVAAEERDTAIAAGIAYIRGADHGWYLYQSGGMFAVEYPEKTPKADKKGRTRPVGFRPMHADGSAAARLRFTLTGPQLADYLAAPDHDARATILTSYKVEPVGRPEGHAEGASVSVVAPTNDLIPAMLAAYGGNELAMLTFASEGILTVPAAVRGNSSGRASARKENRDETTVKAVSKLFATFATPVEPVVVEPAPTEDTAPVEPIADAPSA